MKLSKILVTALASTALVANIGGQANSNNESALSSACRDEPRETVEKLWSMIARGELLTPKGWEMASAFFTKAGATQNSVVRVASDYYAVNASLADGTRAVVDVGFVDEGQIDENLRFTPAPPTQAIKESLRYHLISGPARMVMYGPDGKTVQQVKEVPASKVWQIEGPSGPRWTTVTAAIRFVLAARDEVSDPAIKKNATETLAKLMKLH